MKALLIVLGVLLLLGIGVAGKAAGVNNELVRQQEDVKGAWAQVDVALQRRADLIPNLVETVKGFAGQERAVIDSVTSARAKLAGAGNVPDRIAASNELSSALKLPQSTVATNVQILEKAERAQAQAMESESAISP